MEEIERKFDSQNVCHRGIIKYNSNVASMELGASTVSGINPQILLNGDTKSYKSNSYATNSTTYCESGFIKVQLKTVYKINLIKLLLFDKSINDNFKYWIDVSVDSENWQTVIDYRNYECRSWQFLYFKSSFVKFIRIHTVSNLFLVSLEAILIKESPDTIISTSYIGTKPSLHAWLIKGTYSPSDYNICVIKPNETDFNNGFVHHGLGVTPGFILMELSQPYSISSLRIRLYDGDDRAYQFYIETSVDNSKWEMAVDKRDEFLKSWQNFTFTERQTIYIKICGVKTTAPGSCDFRCTYFECPSQI